MTDLPGIAPEDLAIRKQRLRLWITMLRTTRFVENTLRERLKSDFEATLPRFDVMAALYRNREGMTMTRLSERLMVSNGNVTGIVERLVEEGLVYRSANESDRRATLVGLTDAGSRAFSQMAQAHQEWINDLLGPVAPGDIQPLTDLLQGLRDAQASQGNGRKRKKKD